MAVRPFVLGVTGGIASGKSNVGRILSKAGAPVIDSDKAAHVAYQRGTELYTQIVSVFGSDILAEDGSIDRKLLGAKVFGNAVKLKQLTDLVWPAVKSQVSGEVSRLGTLKAPIVVLEAPLLIEAGWKDLCDRIWMTFVPHEVAKQRLMTRNYLTEEQAEQRIRSQMSNEEKARHVHWVLDTNRPKEETEKIVLQKWEELLRELNITYLPALQTILHE